jgi:hypothetical protein
MQMSERDATPPEATRSGTTPLYQGGAAQHPLPDGGGTAPEYSTTPEYSTRPVAFRRPDALAGLLLLLAGVAAGISLFLDWLAGRRSTGLDLVRAGFGDLGGLFSSGLWQPLMIVLGGGLLFVLGLLVLLPARTHRALGVVALVVSLLAAIAVLVPLADAGWDLGVFDLGYWFGMAVPVLGLLGALKALFTGPKFGTVTPSSSG